MYHCIKIRTVVLQYAPLYYNTHRCITIRTVVLQYAPLYYNTHHYITIRTVVLQYVKGNIYICIYFLLSILYHWTEGDPLRLQCVALLKILTYTDIYQLC